MKKKISILCLLMVFTMTAMTQTLVDGIYYNLNHSEYTAEIVANPNDINYGGNIVIPASISVDGADYSVTSIGAYAFNSCFGLTSIEIPNSVTSIGERAFASCSGLTSIVVAADNPVYDSRENCNAIIETATNRLMSGCNTTIIPNSVTSIGVSAFSGRSGLTSIEIPASVTSIGDLAFSGCSGLTSIEIPNSVTSIGFSAFRCCI